MTSVATNPGLLTPRWYRLKYHETQQAFWNCDSRFIVVPAGRRSGKTEIAKRLGVRRGLMFNQFPDGWFIFGAPTHAQAKRIFWEDLKKLVPEWATQRVFETDMTVRLVTGTEFTVLGMDQPERAEGRPLDGIILDEYADMKKTVWTKHVRAALSTIGRPGWAIFTGVPEGRNHYFELWNDALADETGSWKGFTWKSAEILDPAEIAAAKRELDPMTFKQEYEASFVTFEGRVYYGFERDVHVKTNLKYDSTKPLIFCFDFNVKPGVAVVCQEQEVKSADKRIPDGEPITVVLGEVWIPDHSNTPAVCRKLVYDWGHHRGDILCYGDAAGGARGSARVQGSDWDLVRQTLDPEFPNQLKYRYRHANPKERARVNAMNSRVLSTDNTIRMVVSHKCKHLIEDLEGVRFLEGGAGEIDKFSSPMLTHISDALGYYIEKRFPVEGQGVIDSREV